MAAGLLVIADNLVALNSQYCFGHLRRRERGFIEVTTHMPMPCRSAKDLLSTTYTGCRFLFNNYVRWTGFSNFKWHEVSSSNNGATSNTGAVESTLLDANLLSLLEAVRAGRLQPEAAALQLRERSAGYQQVLDFAQVDSWRAQRTGFPEVLYGAGKPAEQIAAIMQQLAKNDQVAMATRIEPEVAEQVQALLPDVVYNAPGHILTLRATGVRKQPRLPGTVAIVSSGTSDELVAEECRATADVMGCYCFRLSDVSVDGLHRILHNLPAVRAADVVVVISGTDGALPAVVAGLVESPVIAVPTSVGYGAALQGLTPLLSALTASSPGVSVVNIDNGFGAGMLAARILRTAAKLRAQAAAATAASAYPNAG